MKPTVRKYLSLPDPGPQFRKQLLEWSRNYSQVCSLNTLSSAPSLNFGMQRSYQDLVAIGSIRDLQINSGSAFPQLEQFRNETKDWIFGYLAYDLKNEVEELTSSHPDHIGFPDLHFFQPEWVFFFQEDNMVVAYLESHRSQADVENLIKEIQGLPLPEPKPYHGPKLTPRISKSEYLDKIRALKRHIRLGDIYEVNFCQEFFAEQTELDPFDTYARLNEVSPTPFSTFYRCEDRFLMAASPERFLKKEGQKLWSQPIKGTVRRDPDPSADLQLKEWLRNNPKDRSENVMIVDLVRNDLSRTAAKGSVKVEELFGIYSFPQVHQMISTVSSELRKDLSPVDAIREAFPMGSMTGAPKVRAMQLIEDYEVNRRGLYSGAVGYFSPEGDFDFNVVIRGLLYQASEKYLSLQVGGAIIDLSDPEMEYEECLVKAEALFKTLYSDTPVITT